MYVKDEKVDYLFSTFIRISMKNNLLNENQSEMIKSEITLWKTIRLYEIDWCVLRAKFINANKLVIIRI